MANGVLSYEASQREPRTRVEPRFGNNRSQDLKNNERWPRLFPLSSAFVCGKLSPDPGIEGQSVRYARVD